MDGATFDTLVRLVGTSRRGLLQSVGASALGAFAFAALLGADETEAKKGGRKRRRRRCKPKPAGSACQTDKDCCIKKTKRVCGTPQTGGGETVCCGVAGTPCGGIADCCEGFSCEEGACVGVL
jgi:hypothetical protein